MAGEEDGELIGKDVVLGLEVWGLKGEDLGERGFFVTGWKGGEKGVGAEELGEARGGKGMFRGYVDGGAGEAVMGRRKLSGK